MARYLCLAAGLVALAGRADGSGGESWGTAEVRQEGADGISPVVGGIRVRVWDAQLSRTGGFQCRVAIRVARKGGRYKTTETIALRFYDARGRLLGDRTGIGFHVGGALDNGGRVGFSLFTAPPPAGTTRLGVVFECAKLETRPLRILTGGPARKK